MAWQFSERTSRVTSSIIREVLKISLKPGVISFGGGLPAPELFPVAELEAAAKRALAQAERSLQYGPSLGYDPLREFIADRHNRNCNGKVTKDNVMITGGSQQGLDIIGRVFLDIGSPVVVSRPTYLGALQAFTVYGCEYVPVDEDDDGMLVDDIEKALAGRLPRMIYVVPNFMNPDGITLTARRRVKLVELARKLDAPIIDDNPYGELRYSGEPVQSILSMAPERVIGLGTFSKLISPGLRIAWLIAPPDLMDILERLKQAIDLQTSTFGQYLVYEFVKDGALERHIEKLKEAYRARRDLMLECLAEHMPKGTRWTKPEGGLFLWVVLPEHMDAMKLLPHAVAEGVSYVPGSPFYCDGSGHNSMRLNFSNASHEMIRRGIETLGKVIAKHA